MEMTDGAHRRDHDQNASVDPTEAGPNRESLIRKVSEHPAGHVPRAHIAPFLEFRDGRITAQRNCDCYERPGG